MNTIIPTNDLSEWNSSNDGYSILLGNIYQHFNDIAKSENNLYYVPKIDGAMELYDVFVEFLPDAAKQHYNCNTCRRFINRYGRLVYISEDYKIHSALFGFTDEELEKKIPEIFRDSIRFMRNSVESREVACPFETNNNELGVEFDGIFNHFHINTRFIADKRWPYYNNVTERVANRELKYKTLYTAVNRYTKEEINKVESLMQSGALNRSEKFSKLLDNFKTAFKAIHEGKPDDKEFNRRIIYYSSIYDISVCNIKNSPVGLLMDRIKEGCDLSNAVNEFNVVVAPDNYMRPKSAPSMGNILQAEKIVRDLNIANSLNRRYCNIEDIPEKAYIWKPVVYKKKQKEFDVFKSLADETAAHIQNEDFMNGIVNPNKPVIVTLNKFLEIAKTAKRIYYKRSRSDMNFGGLVTAENIEDNPILKWDYPDARNPVSWYLYQHGSDVTDWDINAENVKVNGIISTPNLWGDHDPVSITGVCFLLDEGRDIRYRNIGSALFPEFLRNELFEVRKTIEKFSTGKILGNADNPTAACGIFIFKNNREYSNKFVIDDGSISTLYKISMYE